MKYIVFLTIVTCVLKSFLFLNDTNNSINFRIIKLNITEFEDGKSNFSVRDKKFQRHYKPKS